MTTIKICGIKDAPILRLLDQLSVDYAGFVFAPSKRQVTPQQVQELLAKVESHPKLVGVFVNPSHQELKETLSLVPLDAVQLHGEETVDFIHELKAYYTGQIWKAIRVVEKQQVLQLIERYRQHVDAFLIDAYHPAHAGGTGERFSWSEIPFIHERMGETPCLIAGGINLSNIDELLTKYGATQIDLSSGVETDGRKDPIKIRALVERVREYETYDE
ncbi:phosphoribosylanthranilate isomerase [Brevibacillus ginsengisoli]|uniref:phosphoribosylanthranilate isomerase n=1 Tax=Brevibacillus ginsengisoli TaxID=363854 RepID=UPI003CFAE589